MLHVFDKIGSQGSIFSDERLFEILRVTDPGLIFVDCPISEPPCVICRRPRCPGVSACDDMAVSYMHALMEAINSDKKRKRVLNPQTQRLWDVKKSVAEGIHPHEPSYSANMAPLVVRAKTLQRRLNSLPESYELQETSVPLALQQIMRPLGLDMSIAAGYRDFEAGQMHRSLILERMVKRRWVRLNEIDRIEESVENFHAFIAAFVASLHLSGDCVGPENDFFASQGWLYLPDENKLLKPK